MFLRNYPKKPLPSPLKIPENVAVQDKTKKDKYNTPNDFGVETTTKLVHNESEFIEQHTQIFSIQLRR